MRIRDFFIIVVLALFLVPKPSEALYFTIDNIGQQPIVGASLLFDIAPLVDSQIDVALYSPGVNQFGGGPSASDPSNLYLAFSVDNPVAPGASYTSPLVPMLTDTTFTLRSSAFFQPAPCLTAVVSAGLVQQQMPLLD